jgi:hypothetical protein
VQFGARRGCWEDEPVAGDKVLVTDVQGKSLPVAADCARKNIARNVAARPRKLVITFLRLERLFSIEQHGSGSIV